MSDNANIDVGDSFSRMMARKMRHWVIHLGMLEFHWVGGKKKTATDTQALSNHMVWLC